MDAYLLLRFAHLLGLMLMSASLVGVFVSDMRSRQLRDLKLFAQAVMLIAVFYDGLVVPGALLLLGSGIWLIVSYYDGWSFLTIPWLAGMVLLFAFEFIEGNTITRLYFMRLRPSRGRLWMWDEPRRSLREPAASSSLRSPISLTCRFLS